ncbi:MAG: PIN domain-containing protein [Solirubrobacterales bacterium]
MAATEPSSDPQRGLLDTSVLVGAEQRRLEAELPEELAISVITLAELRIGVLRAEDQPTRARRLETLTRAEAFDALPVDRRVASEFAALVAEARAGGKRPRALDALIGATARAHGLAVYTQDSDFEAMPGVAIKRI